MLRKALLIVGSVFLVLALAVLVSGYDKFNTLTLCKHSSICPAGFSSSDAGLQSFIDTAELQLIYGAVFGCISAILVLFGLFGSKDLRSQVN